jgi:GNAT superfamily N-acetyltransferase
MNKFFNIKQETDKFYSFLLLSFPDLSHRQYNKINNGKHFEGWIWREDSKGTVVACAAIFRRGLGYKMGLFCIHPEKRRQGIGRLFYQYIISRYNPIEWTAITDESIKFYTSMGAINHGKIRENDGVYYTLFKSE